MTSRMNELSQTILAWAFGVTLVFAAVSIYLKIQARQAQQAPPAMPLGKVRSWFYRPGDLGGTILATRERISEALVLLGVKT